jgi:electron transport complex protein RnfD
VLASIFHLIDNEHYISPFLHLTSGGMMCVAFFIATDYVTSPNTKAGQLVFGAGCGLLTFVIRTWGAYPEGVAFAILLMNAATPLIDHYIRPRIYGRDRKGKPLEIPK